MYLAIRGSYLHSVGTRFDIDASNTRILDYLVIGQR